MLTTTHDTPEDPNEKRLNLLEIREALAAKLPGGRPDQKTLYRWMALPSCPMPFKPNPAGGQGRSYLLSHVLAWLDDPQAYWGRKKRTA